MRRAALCFLSIACGKASTPAAPTGDASVVLVVAPATAPAPPPRVLAVPPGVDPELATIAASICAAGYRVEDGKKVLGCREPPPFDRKGRGPDGTFPEHTGDPTTFCSFDVLARGAFTKEGATQIALRFEACHDEAETWDMGMPGSAVVVERGSSGYRVVATALDVNTGRCQPAPSGARTTFICQSGYAAGSVGGMSYWFRLDFADDPPARTFLRLFDDAGMYSCLAHENDPRLAPDGLVELTPVSTQLLDGARIAVEVDRARAAPSPALEVRLRALCKKGPAADIESALGPKKRFRLLFVSHDVPRTYEPDAETKKLLESWEKETPDLAQLRPVAPP